MHASVILCVLLCSSEIWPWFSERISPVLAPWAFEAAGDSKRRIASLEMLATLLCFFAFAGKQVAGQARMLFPAATDNQGNSFAQGNHLPLGSQMLLLLKLGNMLNHLASDNLKISTATFGMHMHTYAPDNSMGAWR